MTVEGEQLQTSHHIRLQYEVILITRVNCSDLPWFALQSDQLVLHPSFSRFVCVAARFFDIGTISWSLLKTKIVQERNQHK